MGRAFRQPEEEGCEAEENLSSSGFGESCMKVKFLPEDFQVEELPQFQLAESGDYACYRLTKKSLTTPEAIQRLAQRWNRAMRDFHFGGLKDRHAVTVQHISLLNGPREGIQLPDLLVEYLGQLLYPFRGEDFGGNRFQLTVRDLEESELPAREEQLRQVANFGVANYFDDQRFGSVERGQPFVARELIAGNYETSLKLALTAPSESDRKSTRRKKEQLILSWGDWAKCHARYSGVGKQSLRHLVRQPTDFLGAIRQLPPIELSLFLNAYQSHLWNRFLSRWIASAATRVALLDLKLGRFPTPLELPTERLSEWEQLEIPYPSVRLKLDETDSLRLLIESVMQEENLPLAEMKIDGLRKPFFSKGTRLARLMPTNLTWESSADEHHPGRRKMLLNFTLPRGGYATMVLKATF
jgi:tRNA pseudouridine13 synthase